MSSYIASEVAKEMLKKKIQLKQSDILLLGITFKENCPDIRNTRVVDIYKSLECLDANVDVFDYWADSKEVKEEFGINLLDNLDNKEYDAIILAVAHNKFLDIDFSKLKKKNSVIYDVKAVVEIGIIDKRL